MKVRIGIYIEGDNLEVLKLLQKTYHGKVKLIYIDPPYNTGKDFIYPDDFRDSIKNYLEITGQVDEEGRKISTNSEASGRYHTEWLNMIYPRLRLAKNLLADDGSIFISIDDNEVDNLKKICNEIFGESNFVACICWHKNYASANDSKNSSNVIDYLLVYRKTDKFTRNLLPRTGKQNDLYRYDSKDGKGLWRSDNLSVKTYSESYNYPITNSNTGVQYYPPSGRCWMTNARKIIEWIDEGRVFFGQKGDGAPQLKRYLQEVQQGVVPLTYWSYDDCGHNDEARKEIKGLFENPPFDTPKPTRLLKRVLQLASNEDSFVLDFFSGSATTAHAVMQINADDGGNRKYIMVQLPEPCNESSEAFKTGYKNICEIGKERIQRAGEKIVEENKDKEGIENIDIGFKVFKLDSSNIKRWDFDGENLEITIDNMIDNFVPNRSEEDVLYEIMLKYGIDLTYPVEARKIVDKKVFSIGFGALFICIDNEITLEVVEGIVKLKDELNPEITRVIFKDNGFKNDSVKTNAIQILRRNKIQEIMSI